MLQHEFAGLCHSGDEHTQPASWRFKAARFPQGKLFSFEKQRFWDTMSAAHLNPGPAHNQPPWQHSRWSPLSGDKQHEGLSATTFSRLALSLTCHVPSDIFLCFFPLSPTLSNMPFASFVYKSKTLWGRYFSDCLFVLAETSAGFSQALTYDSLAAFFCLKHWMFLSDSEHFRTWIWKSTYSFITKVFMLLVLPSCNRSITKSQSKNLS